MLKVGSPFDGTLFRIDNGKPEPVGAELDRLPVSISIDPTNENHVIVVSHAGGASETEDGGQNWIPVDGTGLPDRTRVGYNRAVFDPEDPKTVYLLGGGDVVSLDLQPSGIEVGAVNTVYRSQDGGKTWANLNDGNMGANPLA